MKKIKSIILLATLFLLIISLNNIVRADDGYGNVTIITPGGSVTNSGKENVEIKYESVELTWSAADPNVGRDRNGYWIGYKIEAPTDIITGDEQAQKATFKTRINGGQWSENKSFFAKKDGNYWLNAWTYVDPALIENNKSSEEITLYEAVFDWNGEGTKNQTVTIKLKPSAVNFKETEDMTTVKIKEVGTGASGNVTVFTAPRSKKFLEGLGNSDKAILTNIQNKAGFQKFYKVNSDTFEFDPAKIAEYTEFDPATAELTEDNVYVVAYINNKPSEPAPAPAPAPAATTPEKDNTPKTGSNSIIEYVFAITALSGVGIVVLSKKH